MLKNTAKTLTPEVATAVKKKFQASITNGDTFVTGMDWDYKMIQATAAESAFLEAMEYGLVDIARFFGVPADMLDAGSAKSTKIVYANMTQRNLQFLLLKLGPAVSRREHALSTMLSAPRNVRLDTGGLLRMDPAGQQAILASKLGMKQITPSEARAEDNRAPFTEAQLQEIERLYGAASAPAPVDPLPEPPANPEGAVK
jgi:phage portal protein BeeE